MYPRVRMGIRKELIEGADGPTRPLVPTRIVELEVRRGDHCGIGSAYPSTVVSIHAAIFPRPTDPNWLAPSTSKSRGVWPILPTVLPPSVCRCSRPAVPLKLAAALSTPSQ